MARGQKVDEELKQQILAYYASCGNASETARKFNISEATVRSIRDRSKDSYSKLHEQKRVEHIDKAWQTINLYIDRVQLPEVIEKTYARDAAILIGTLWDKIHKKTELELKREELEIKKKELAMKEKGPDKVDVSIYVNALNGKAEEVWNDEEKD